MVCKKYTKRVKILHEFKIIFSNWKIYTVQLVNYIVNWDELDWDESHFLTQYDIKLFSNRPVLHLKSAYFPWILKRCLWLTGSGAVCVIYCHV